MSTTNTTKKPAKKITKKTVKKTSQTQQNKKVEEPKVEEPKVEPSTQTNTEENMKPNRVKLFTGTPSPELEQEVNKWIVQNNYDIVDIQTCSFGITNVYPNGLCTIAVTFNYQE